MTKGQILKQLVNGPGNFGIVILLDGTNIDTKLAIQIWEELNIEIGDDQEKDPQEEDPEKPIVKKYAKKDIDDGKIKALRTAGWTVEQIAEEMKCSPVTIYNHLKAM